MQNLFQIFLCFILLQKPPNQHPAILKRVIRHKDTKRKIKYASIAENMEAMKTKKTSKFSRIPRLRKKSPKAFLFIKNICLLPKKQSFFLPKLKNNHQIIRKP